MPLSSDEYLKKSRALRAQDETGAAIHLLREAVQTHPCDADLYEALGIALRDDGQRPEAVGAWREAVRLQPDWECPRLILALWLREDGRVREAIQVLLEGAEAYPHQRGLWYREIGYTYERSGNRQKAILFYDRVLEEFPDDVLARAWKRAALEQEQKRQRARHAPRRRRW